MGHYQKSKYKENEDDLNLYEYEVYNYDSKNEAL